MINPTTLGDGMCVICAADRDRGLTCEPCRHWLPTALASLPRLAEQARAELIPADDSGSRPVHVCRTCGLTVPYTADRRYARHDGHPQFDDPEDEKRHAGWVKRRLIDHTGGPAPSLAPDIIVTGGDGEAPVPLDLHLHDLLADVVRDGGRPVDVTGDNWVQALTTRPVTVVVSEGHRGHREVVVLDRTPRRDGNGWRVMVPAGDQVGVVPVAQVLDQEVRALIDAGAPGSRWRPTPTIGGLTEWLGRRSDWACDHYPAVDQLVAAVKLVRGQLMGVLGEFDPEPELCDGVACNRCDLRMLYRRQDGSGCVDCQNPDCRKVFTAAEYLALVRGAGADEREQRGPVEVAALLRSALPRSADLRVA
jgi:hypothetical protein